MDQSRPPDQDRRDSPANAAAPAAMPRRDFLAGIAASATVGAAMGRASAASAPAGPAPAPAVPAPEVMPEPPAGTSYPPRITGLRGQYPGSFEAAHELRDEHPVGPIAASDTGERYDLVVVGAGISGLSAVHFFRKALGPDRRVLILDNHDDFGGHAKRNEFVHDGRMFLSFGGTMSIETPFPYSFTAKALLAELGIDPARYRNYEHPEVFAGMGEAVFFDRENFGSDKIVSGAGTRPWGEFFADAPLTKPVREQLTRLHAAAIDYLPGLDPEAKAHALKRMSYGQFLTDRAGLSAAAVKYFDGIGFRNNMRVDTCPAYAAARSGAPGFKGMAIGGEPMVHADYFHFPDGNASIARLLVSRLVAGVFSPGQSPESIVTAAAAYDALDLGGSTTRIRLRSTALRVEHSGEPGADRGVRVVYVKDGRRSQVEAGNVVLACFNNIVRYLVPDLPEEQKSALSYASKVPMQYTNVLLRNWHPWKRLGARTISAPHGYHPFAMLAEPVSMGAYRCSADPSEPIVVTLFRNPNKPGIPRRDQNRAGRAMMLAATYEDVEREVHSQLSRMLGPAGFDARDVLAITVNRWPHGYAYTYDTIGDPDIPDEQRPHVRGRRPFGRIAIANADAGAAAFTNVAIDQAERAVQECLISRGMT